MGAEEFVWVLVDWMDLCSAERWWGSSVLFDRIRQKQIDFNKIGKWSKAIELANQRLQIKSSVEVTALGRSLWCTFRLRLQERVVKNRIHQLDFRLVRWVGTKKRTQFSQFTTSFVLNFFFMVISFWLRFNGINGHQVTYLVRGAVVFVAA